MRKLLLTGSNGFVGSYFKQHYKDRYDIQTFSFLKDDFEALHVKGIDVVMHLGALVHQPKANVDLYKTSNVENTMQLAKKAKEEGVRHFIFMSTVAVYDETLNMLVEDSECAPSTPYGRSKFEAERELLALADENFKVSIVRPPMVYGHNAPGNIKSLVNLISKMQVLPFGGINNKRSFVYVGNLCAMIDRIIETGKPGVFLASDDRALSTTELIKHIALAMNKKIYLVTVPFFSTLLKWLKPSLQKRLFQNLEVDNTQTKKVLGFQNPYSVEEGIRSMVKGK